MLDSGFLSSSFVSAPSGSGDIPADPPSAWQTYASTKGPDGTRPSASEGTLCTPGTSGARGGYANLGVLHATQAMDEIEIVAHTVAIAGENRMASIDLAVDPAGGTSFAGNVKIADMQLGAPGAITQLSRWIFNLRIPAGASIGVAATSLNATTTAFRICVNGRGNPTDASLVPVGAGVQTLGVPTPATPGGTAITPGSASEGAWFEIGTLAQDVFALEYGYAINNTTIASNNNDVDIAIGAADSTTVSGTKRIVISNHQTMTTASEAVFRINGARQFCRGLAGEKVYARAQTVGTPDTGTSVAVYAVYE